ncbi:hypothetical protein [Variovorax sp. RA8]|uniref:hypothetical protein n=1 Tax=Variovorax sp. (strain JCM 16519 / RA8) TaxID=662548 RepID=UPI00131853E5|nr:hypothetical protein [Variovorax sp. RA8]VTU44922.1 hypothetical protein RA8P2_00358 [Variovorax sp. RA8]
MVDIPVIALFVAAIACGFVGALVGAAFVVNSLRKGQIAVRTVELPRQLMALDSLSVSTNFVEEDGRVVMSMKKEIQSSQVQAETVQAWLDDNDLVAQFKGRDFKVPPPTSNPWKATQ